jgi:hypothetical protein
MSRRQFLPVVLTVSLLPVALCGRADDPRPDPKVDPSWITFLSHRTGGNLLYRMRPDGSECKPIFGGPVKDAPGLGDGQSLYRDPHWTWQSPDRKYFVSWANDSIRPSATSRVRPRESENRGRTDGTGSARALTPVCSEAAAWSPDSRRVAYAVRTDRESSAHPTPTRMTRIYVVAIDGASEDFIFEYPGTWSPQDWSPDGKKLLLRHFLSIDDKLTRIDLFELDLTMTDGWKAKVRTGERWQNDWVTEALSPVLGDTAAVWPHDARYSPDGKTIALTAIRKKDKPGPWKALDFELGVVDRAAMTYRKVVRYEDGLRGPICWSPDGTEILFSRPLKADDKREALEDSEVGAERGLGLWGIKPNGTGERFLTTGWSPDWR